jgi:hypothetical protein
MTTLVRVVTGSMVPHKQTTLGLEQPWQTLRGVTSSIGLGYMPRGVAFA